MRDHCMREVSQMSFVARAPIAAVEVERGDSAELLSVVNGEEIIGRDRVPQRVRCVHQALDRGPRAE